MKLGKLTSTILIVGIIVITFLVTKNLGPFVTEKQQINNTQVVKTLTQEKQVVLLNIGIVDLYDENKSIELFGQELLGTKKMKFVRAEFNAKLGIDGKTVEIKKNSENNYTVTIPKFIFIGHSDISFAIALDDKEIFSLFTSDINETEIVNSILAEEGQLTYLEKYRTLLEESAIDFYSSLVRGIDEDIKLEFVFEN